MIKKDGTNGFSREGYEISTGITLSPRARTGRHGRLTRGLISRRTGGVFVFVCLLFFFPFAWSWKLQTARSNGGCRQSFGHYATHRFFALADHAENKLGYNPSGDIS
jgi:hypothetical protein